MVLRKDVYIFLLAVLGSLNCSKVFSASAGDYQENGVFLSYSYCNDQKFVNLLNNPVAPHMKNDYKCKYWFVNVGLLNSKGIIGDPTSRIKSFLNEVKNYENANNCKFIVIAWLNGDKPNLDLSNPSIRSAITTECRKFVSGSERESYVSDSNRTFDGISMDVEPCGNGDTYFDNYKILMDNIRSSFNSNGLSSKLTSVCAPQFGEGPKWYWNAAHYYNMASSVNFVLAMTYDSGCTSASAYQTWMSKQTCDILRAVSGRYFNDALHPMTSNGVKVFIGFPAFPQDPAHPENHNSAYENIKFASVSVLEGLNSLEKASDPSINFFQSGFVFIQSDGSGRDGRAAYSKDWQWWGKYWLGAR
jgi:hypothetical protein